MPNCLGKKVYQQIIKKLNIQVSGWNYNCMQSDKYSVLGS